MAAPLSFFTPKKDRRGERWCVTDAIFRLSVKEINIDTLCFLPEACWLCVLDFDFITPPLSHFFLKNQTITDVATEIETLILEGLSAQVILGVLAITPVCCAGVKPPRIPRARRGFGFFNSFSVLVEWAWISVWKCFLGWVYKWMLGILWRIHWSIVLK